MKLLIEDIQDFEILEESNNGKKDYFIKGIFLQSEVKNRNGRMYPKNVMESAVSKYIEDYVSKNRALGTLSHDPTPSINPDRISHVVNDLVFEGNNVIGKAKVLNTTCGKQLKALIDGGVSFGVSSRSLGSLKESNGVKIVQPDLCIRSIDSVIDPSAPDAWVEAMMEEAEWVMENGEWIQKHLEESQNRIRKASQQQIEEVALEIWKNFIGSIK
jgi:hypothetical protein